MPLPFFKRKRRVLVLDDDVSMQKLVSLILRRQGFRVDAVGSGRRAIDAIEHHDYFVILLDLMMPIEGGMTVIAYLRERNPELLKRVVLLTATPEPVLKHIAGDVFAVVRKPLDANNLVSTVERLA